MDRYIIIMALENIKDNHPAYDKLTNPSILLSFVLHLTQFSYHFCSPWESKVSHKLTIVWDKQSTMLANK